MSKPVVKIYTLPTCGFCQTAKEYFKAHNINYKEMDASIDTIAGEMVLKTHQYSVPVIEVNDQIVIGFNKPALDVLLEI
jgi:glutaredoxin 3